MHIISKRVLTVLFLFSSFLTFLTSFSPKLPENLPHAYSFNYSSTYSTPDIPKDNPLTVEGVALGRLLFYDPELSVNNKTSCSSCHQQKWYFSDGLSRAIGTHGDTLKWHTMNIVNLAWQKNFFWNGRDTSIEEVVSDHINNPLEMGGLSENELVKRLSTHKKYLDLFKQAFPDNAISVNTVSKAVGQFVRIIVSKYTYMPEEYKSRSDMFSSNLINADTYASSVARLSLMKCKNCHGTEAGGQTLSVYMDDSVYKAPNLVNVRFTGPYMHDGRFRTLKEVYAFYKENLADIAARNPGQLGKEELSSLFTAYDLLHTDEMYSDNEDTTITTNPEYSNPFTKNGFKW